MGALPSNVLFNSLSPRMWLRCWAMTLCCSTLQWFSMDRMTGYSDTWMGERRLRRQGGREWVCNLTLESIIIGESQYACCHIPVGCAWLAERPADGWTRGHEATIADRCSYTAGSDMHVNLAAFHFGMWPAVCGRSLASSPHRAFRLCLGYQCTVVLPLINLQWDAERFVDTALQDNESKNNCNASKRGLQNMLGLLEKPLSDKCDHLSNQDVSLWSMQCKKCCSKKKLTSERRITWLNA